MPSTLKKHSSLHILFCNQLLSEIHSLAQEGKKSRRFDVWDTSCIKQTQGDNRYRWRISIQMFGMETWPSGNRCASLVTYKKWYMVTSNTVQQRPAAPICFTLPCCALCPANVDILFKQKTRHFHCKPSERSVYFENDWVERKSCLFMIAAHLKPQVFC